MLDNLVFISGPHGAGKSTLIKKLLKKLPNSVSPELESRTPQFYWGNFTGKRNFFHRQALKYAQRAIENYEYWALAIREPGKIIIGDRCVYDGLAYRMAGIQLGWIK
jgi:thymidylate kinase